jgi:glycosyltransferase involved in cell wall biosynthesis
MGQIILTIIVPAYNEKKSISKIIDQINEKIIYTKQIIVIDDFSNDGTRDIVQNLSNIDEIIFHQRNMGKGAAIKSAIPFIKGNIVAIQDADLEYDPEDLNKLAKEILNQKTNVAYGSRVLNKKRYGNNNFISNFRVFGNHVLTILSNLFNSQQLTDAHTCYKVFKREIFLKLNLKENDFAFCPEVNTKISLLNEKILELPISYKGRNVQEGKKIRFKDALKALLTIIKYKYLKNE